MYTCTYVYLYISIHSKAMSELLVYINICIYLYMYHDVVRLDIRQNLEQNRRVMRLVIYSYFHIFIYTYTHTHTHTHLLRHAGATGSHGFSHSSESWEILTRNTPRYICIYVSMYIYMYTHTHTHTHTPAAAWRRDMMSCALAVVRISRNSDEQCTASFLPVCSSSAASFTPSPNTQKRGCCKKKKPTSQRCSVFFNPLQTRRSAAVEKYKINQKYIDFLNPLSRHAEAQLLLISEQSTP